MLVETGKKIFCLSLDTGKQSGTFRPLSLQWNTYEAWYLFGVKMNLKPTCTCKTHYKAYREVMQGDSHK